MSGLAAGQREAMAATLAAAQPGAPTLCAGWTAVDLAAHLVVRDRRPDSAPGAVMSSGPLHAWSERVRVARRDGTAYDDLVALVRRGPLLTRLPAVDDAVNLAELFIHTEDVRRAAPEWQPRVLAPETVEALWRQVRTMGRLSARPGKGASTVLETPDGRSVRLGSGPQETRIRGEAPELLLWVAGRRGAARVAVTTGPAGQ